MYVYTIHAGGKPWSPIIPEFDSDTCKRIWDYFWDQLFAHNRQCKWGQHGLGVVELCPDTHGYDLHVTVYLEGREPIDAWMWKDLT